jgi:hypothetical protein
MDQAQLSEATEEPEVYGLCQIAMGTGYRG